MDLQKLKKQLHDAKIRPGRTSCPPFVPLSSLEEVLSLDNVLSALQDPIFSIHEHKWEDTAQIIVREGRKSFAILLEIGCEPYLSAFIENGLLNSVPADFSLLSQHLSESQARLFESIQSDYVVHTFCRGVWTRKIKSSTRLPYVSQEVIGRGGYSTVYSVSICSTHQEFVPEARGPSITLVRKELQPQAQDGKAEADLLFLLGSVRHPNVVELLGAYVFDGITNLLFQPADLDLQSLLDAKDRPEAFAEDFTFFRAMSGLAAGIAHLHNFIDRGQQRREGLSRSYRGYHHDIKPRNVLIRGSDFILADFGLANLKQVDAIEDDSKTRWRVGTFDYGAPECRNAESFEPGIVGRAIDIWSLGCVAAEVGVYMSTGRGGVADFRNERHLEGIYGTMQCFHDGTRLSSKVDDYFQKIGDRSSSRSLHKLILEVRNMLASEASHRPDPKQVEISLCQIAVESLFDLLLTMIEKELQEAGDHLLEHNLFRALVLIERHRLQAWAVALGFASHGQEPSHASRVEHLVPDFYQSLKSVYDGLNFPPHFDILKDARDFVLHLLRQANEELCVHLHEDARLSIDSIFLIMTTHQAMEQCVEQSKVLQETVSPLADSSAAAAMKYMSLKLGQPLNGDLAAHRIEQSLMAPDKHKYDVKNRPPVWHYSYGHHTDMSTPSIVEFVPYWETTPNMPDSRSQEFEDIVESMYTRVLGLVSLLKSAPELPGFRVLDCLGTFHDPSRQRFGLVYGFPGTTNFPVRLNKLMRQFKDPGLIDPNPAEKLCLAKLLVACVQSFHISGWIHKSISSLNVVFFPQSADDLTTVDISQPFIIGFDHSRKGGKGQYSRGPDQLSLSKEYQHPDYRKGVSGAKRSFDYYSLGLVLLEIGFWVSINIICDKPEFMGYDSYQLRNEYLNLCNTRLGRVMGPKYQAATRSCLEYGSGGEELEEQLRFQKSVLDTLNQCGPW